MKEKEFKEIEKKIDSFFNNENHDYNMRLNESLRFLAKHRSARIANTIIKINGQKIMYGPFKGMSFLDSVSEGCYVPKLLGLYESELHNYIGQIIDDKPEVIINIGSAEGYYAVGLKRLLPDTHVFAFDTDSNAQDKCRELSAINNVDIEINGEFSSEILSAFKEKKVVVLCDIEGDENNLINENTIEMYKASEVCMELHFNKAGQHNKDIMPEIFKNTHELELIWQKGKNFVVPDFIAGLSHLDILLSAWEFRSYPTPWLIARPLQ